MDITQIEIKKIRLKCFDEAQDLLNSIKTENVFTKEQLKNYNQRLLVFLKNPDFLNSLEDFANSKECNNALTDIMDALIEECVDNGIFNEKYELSTKVKEMNNALNGGFSVGCQ